MSTADIVAQDGVLHVVDSILVPPKEGGGHDGLLDGFLSGSKGCKASLTVKDLVERLSHYIEEDGSDDL